MSQRCDSGGKTLLQSLQVFFPRRDEGEESGVGDLRKTQEKNGTDAEDHGEGNPLFK
jgi:hypothetical protein